MTTTEQQNNKGRRGFLTVCMAGFLSLSLAGCAGPQTAEGVIYDPLEETNRAIFAVNDALDQAVARPVAKAYRAVTPQLARDGVRNFLQNLRTPVNLANQLLQGDIEGAAGDLSRFAMNTTIGIGGLFDVAAETGLEHEHEDFGQTLAVWGFDHGPYFVLPLMGPSSLRDSTGLLVDILADPVRLYLFNTDQHEWAYARTGATFLSTREELLDVIDDLRANSFDYYAAMRSAYIQHRAALVRDEAEPTGGAMAIPDYDDEDF